MGAEVPVWIEVERSETVWVRARGVTVTDAVAQYRPAENERVTGRATYERPTYPARVEG